MTESDKIPSTDRQERIHEPTCSWMAFGPCDGDQCYWAVQSEDGKYHRVETPCPTCNDQALKDAHREFVATNAGCYAQLAEAEQTIITLRRMVDQKVDVVAIRGLRFRDALIDIHADIERILKEDDDD